MRTLQLVAILLAAVTIPNYRTSGVDFSKQTSQAGLSKEGKFEYAVVRSEDCAKIIALLNEMRDSNFPKEVADKAEAIAVFPRVKQQKMLFTLTTQGYGVISARTGNGWTLPAFYQFSGGGYTGSFFAEDQIAVILLFMNKATLSWFEKGGVVLKGSKKVIARAGGCAVRSTEERSRECKHSRLCIFRQPAQWLQIWHHFQKFHIKS